MMMQKVQKEINATFKMDLVVKSYFEVSKALFDV